MATYKTSVEVISHLAHLRKTGTPEDFDEAIRLQPHPISTREIVATGAVYTLLHTATRAGTMVSAEIAPDTTQAANANSRNYAIVKNDGVGGADTVLGTELDGTATGVTANQVSDLLMIEDDAGSLFSVGDRLWLRTTHNGTGVALSISGTFSLKHN